MTFERVDRRRCKESVYSTYDFQSCLDPPKSKWHDGQRRINKAVKCIRENTALFAMLRGGVRVQSGRSAVSIRMSAPRRDKCSGVLIGRGVTV